MPQLLLLLAGFCLAVAGVALIFLPAALIVAGVALSTFAILYDFGGERR